VESTPYQSIIISLSILISLVHQNAYKYKMIDLINNTGNPKAAPLLFSLLKLSKGRNKTIFFPSSVLNAFIPSKQFMA
jgi:hypothetical protein